MPREGRRFVVTTVVRGAPLDASSGTIYVVDLDARRVLSAAPIVETPWSRAGTNPRGGHRGGRGVAIVDGRLAVANADQIHVLDRSWRPVDVLTDTLLGDVHEIAPAPGGLWVCATRADSLVRLGWDGEVQWTWSWRDDPALVAAFGYRAVAPIDGSIDYRDMSRFDQDAVDISHLNSVWPVDDGVLVSLGRVRFPSPSRGQRLLARLAAAAQAAVVGRPLARRVRAERISSFGADPQPGTDRRGLVVLVRPGRPAEVVIDRPLVEWPNHNVLEHGREIVLCETSRETLLAVNRDTGAERGVEVPGSSGFVRGLVALGDERFLVGSRRPATLHVVDFAARRSDAVLTLSDTRHESVHDIAALPEDWNDPPATFG